LSSRSGKIGLKGGKTITAGDGHPSSRQISFVHFDRTR